MKQDRPTVTMNIKTEFFAALLAVPPRKKIEYRSMSAFWRARLEDVTNRPFKLRLLNGMLPPGPEATVMVNKVVHDYRKKEFRLHLRRVLQVRYWDRDREQEPL